MDRHFVDQFNGLNWVVFNAIQVLYIFFIYTSQNEQQIQPTGNPSRPPDGFVFVAGVLERVDSVQAVCWIYSLLYLQGEPECRGHNPGLFNLACGRRPGYISVQKWAGSPKLLYLCHQIVLSHCQSAGPCIYCHHHQHLLPAGGFILLHSHTLQIPNLHQRPTCPNSIRHCHFHNHRHHSPTNHSGRALQNPSQIRRTHLQTPAIRTRSRHRIRHSSRVQ